MSRAGTIKDGDYFPYTDAWNPTVIQLKYMAELLGVNIRIGGLWHAGSYDPKILGRLIGAKSWVRHAESSMFACYDDNYFATDFHIDMFVDAFSKGQTIRRVGWPIEYLKNSLDMYKNMEKRDLIFQNSNEKQSDIFRDLADSMNEYEFLFAQEHNLTKNEYLMCLVKQNYCLVQTYKKHLV